MQHLSCASKVLSSKAPFRGCPARRKQVGRPAPAYKRAPAEKTRSAAQPPEQKARITAAACDLQTEREWDSSSSKPRARAVPIDSSPSASVLSCQIRALDPGLECPTRAPARQIPLAPSASQRSSECKH